MSSQFKVRSRFRKGVDDEALGLAFVMLARILEEETRENTEVQGELRASAEAALPVPPARPWPAASSEKPLRQVYFEDVEALKAGGWSNAEALREVARRYGKRESAVRQGIYMYRRDGKGRAA